MLERVNCHKDLNLTYFKKTLATSANLVFKIVPVETGQYLCSAFTFFTKKDRFFKFSCTLKDVKLKGKVPDNHGDIICSLFKILTGFPFTTNEMELDYYHQYLNVTVDSRLGKQLNKLDLRKLGSLKETHKKFGINGKIQASHPKEKF